MRYIILAAGMGTRLQPFSKNFPKCMVQIGHGESVIQRLVRLIRANDSSSKITVVTGFKHKDVEASLSGCDFVNNPFFSVTNSIASLWFAKNHLDDKVVIVNGDIVVSEVLLKKIIQSPDEDIVFLDSSIKNDGDYNVQVNNNQVVVMSKQLDTYFGEYVGITRLTKQSAIKLGEEISKMIEEQSYGEWYENALVMMILNAQFILKYSDVSDYDWTEIDSVNHILAARKIEEKEWKKV